MNTPARTKRGTTICSLLLLQALAAADAGATDLAYGVDVGAGYTDNIALTSTDKRSETIATTGLQFSLSQLSRRIDANLLGNLAYYDYLRNTYNPELVGNFTGGARLSIVPERFVWVVQDNFGQGVRDIFAAVTPDNRENINYFTTGPEFTARFADEYWTRLSAQYSKVSYQTSPFDNDRYSGSLGLFRDLSSASTLSANIHTEKVNYDSDLPGANFDQQEAFLQYFAHGKRTTASVDLGYTELKQSGGEKSNGLLTRVEFTRQISSSAKLTLQLGRQFSDQGNAFQLQQGIGGINLQTQSVTQTTSPFTQKYATLGLDFQKSRTGLGATVSYYDEQYDQQTLYDRKRLNGDIHASRSITPALQLSLTATYDKENFTHAPGDYRDIDGLLALNWRLTRFVSVILQYDRLNRSASSPGGSYKENRAWLQLRYGKGVVKTSPISSTQPTSAMGISGR